jgi:hypothetical protein
MDAVNDHLLAVAEKLKLFVRGTIVRDEVSDGLGEGRGRSEQDRASGSRMSMSSLGVSLVRMPVF